MQPPTKVPMVETIHGSHIVPISEDGDRRRATVDQIKAYVGAEATGAASAAVQAVTAEAKARSTADQAEAKARGDGDAAAADALTAESRARAAADKVLTDADADEAKARVDADKALAARQAKLTGTLTLPAGLALLAGKTLRTATVAGLKAGDDIAVTPKAALPSGVAMAETYCLVDGVLTVALTATALITLAAKIDIPLGVVALR